MKQTAKKKKPYTIYGVMCRFLFIFMLPIWTLNIVFAGIIALPYWILTGKAIYGTKMVQGFNDWLFNLT